MIDFKALFVNATKFKEIETGRELSVVQMDVPFETPCPDQFTLTDVETTVEEHEKVYNEKTNSMKNVIKTRVFQSGKAKSFEEENGDFRGGNIRGKKGDYIAFDGRGFFVVREKDEQGVPVFHKRFMKA